MNTSEQHQKCVLVTGANGNIGKYVVDELLRRGCRVIATDIQFNGLKPAPRLETHRVDLTEREGVAELLNATRPEAIVHLAAVIPPYCYEQPDVAQRVNVGATEHLIEAGSALVPKPHFVLASSMAVYGSRNPHRSDQLLQSSTPVAASELYGVSKVAAEELVRNSGLPWTILRLGGVLSPKVNLSSDAGLAAMESSLPVDGRIHTVAVEDVAVAFSQAVALAPLGEVLLIGGDRTHLRLQADVGRGIAEAMGLVNVMPVGRKGNPDDDSAWFITDWLDTRRSQEILGFQSRTFATVLDNIRRNTGWRRALLRLASPLARKRMASGAPNRGHPGIYADPWSVIADRWGPPLMPCSRPDDETTPSRRDP